MRADLRGRIEPRGERGGDADEPAAVERPVHGLPVPVDDVERGAMKAPSRSLYLRAAPIRPDGKPAGIVEERVGEEHGGGVVLARARGGEFPRARSSPTNALAQAGRPRRAVRDGLVRVPRRDRLLPDRSQPGLGLRRRARRPSAAGSGQDVHRVLQAALERHGVHSRRQSELERPGQAMGPGSCDYLFVLVGDGRRWFIPSDAIGGRTCIALGGPKYAEFEVEPGRPLPEPPAWRGRLYNRLLIARGDVRVAKGDAAVNRLALPTQVRILLPPLSP